MRTNRLATVLLVDDDESVRRVIEEHLSEIGYDVIAAPDTLAGQREIQTHPETDLCLVDLVMPSNVPDGAAFALSVRKLRPGVPVILMTGYYGAAVRIGHLASGVIYKPVDFDALDAEIERQLSAPKQSSPAA
jgi:DNA-binding NtrC family response regulator